MITYRYNLWWDLKWAWRTLFDKQMNYRQLKNKALIFYLPTPRRFWKLWFNIPKSPQIEEPKDIMCYWISSGTWGAYSLPNKIFICPWNIERYENGGMVAIIKHEIAHLRHHDTVKNMGFDEREEYVEKHGG